jgi:RHS repeat-associated protein
MNVSYNYSPAANNGRITGSVDAVTGENVSYTYDALNRLTGVSASGMWSEGYTYDGFGNLTQKAGTGGTPNAAPSMTASFNGNNHQVGVNYDLNGNPTGDSTTNNSWDVENRLVGRTSKTAPYGGVWFGYDPSGKRIRKDTNDNSNGLSSQTTEFYFYGITGQKLLTYQCTYPDGQTMLCGLLAENVYFRGKLMVSNGVGVVTDRLGSVRVNAQGESFSYYPYGEERTSTVDGRDKFGTYFRDIGQTGEDYAGQRYYSEGTGRFWNVDPSSGSGAGDPGSLNKYAYANGDPVNNSDPSGLCNDSDAEDTCTVVAGGARYFESNAIGWAAPNCPGSWTSAGQKRFGLRCVGSRPHARPPTITRRPGEFDNQCPGTLPPSVGITIPINQAAGCSLRDFACPINSQAAQSFVAQMSPNQAFSDASNSLLLL